MKISLHFWIAQVVPNCFLNLSCRQRGNGRIVDTTTVATYNAWKADLKENIGPKGVGKK